MRGEDREGEVYGTEGDSRVVYTGCFAVKDDSNYRTCNKRDAGETSFKSQQNLASHEAKLHTLRSFCTTSVQMRLHRAWYSLARAHAKLKENGNLRSRDDYQFLETAAAACILFETNITYRIEKVGTTAITK